MKNQSLKLTINSTADTMHAQENKIKEQEQVIMSLAR